MPTDADFEMLYGNLKAQETISFWSTSFIRGTTFDDAILIIDECQNLNFHELDSIMTRVGDNSRIMFCGDAAQTDLIKTNEKNGILDFMRIMEQMNEQFSMIEFGVDDIVRSGLVRDYIITKISFGTLMNRTFCNHLGEIELDRKETAGCRLYKIPNGEWVPSITSITSFYNREKFIKWRKKIGEEKANKITKKDHNKRYRFP